MSTSPPSGRGRTMAAALSLLVVLAAGGVVLVSALGGDGSATSSGVGRDGSAPSPHRAPLAPTAPSTASTGAPPGVERGLPVVTGQESIVDTSRPVVRDGVTESSVRSLPTDVWMPSSAGRFPLVVFVHGYDVGPLTYQRFLSTLAGAGYVVVAPSFPLEDPSRGLGLDRSDLPNEATDVSFVISAMLAGPLASRIEPARVAVVGHSDGADVALMVGYQVGRMDPRVDAVVADAPDPMSGPIAASRVPLLLIQGNADSVVPYASSTEVFAQVRAPSSYLTLLGADHLPPIAGGTPWTADVDTSVADFLDAHTAGRSSPSSVPGELGALPLSQLRTHG